jgi:hypothetical protein
MLLGRRRQRGQRPLTCGLVMAVLARLSPLPLFSLSRRAVTQPLIAVAHYRPLDGDPCGVLASAAAKAAETAGFSDRRVRQARQVLKADPARYPAMNRLSSRSFSVGSVAVAGCYGGDASPSVKPYFSLCSRTPALSERRYLSVSTAWRA